MKLATENYEAGQALWPREGRHILAHQTETQLVVYQAYKPAIADYAVQNQTLGGADFNYGRMSWVKPNFLWMMYRCGWASKENQERVLALWLDKTTFDEILEQAAYSTFSAGGYTSEDAWKQDLATKPVRLQWDPDHSPTGEKLGRRAIQLGLKGEVLEKFGRHQIRLIEDVTDFVREQQQHVASRQFAQLLVPQERLYRPSSAALVQRLGLSGA